VETGGAGVNCHTGRKSCFYRQIRRADDGETRLVFD
jgi:phosphoribosyl-AMP cyclohydrolase